MQKIKYAGLLSLFISLLVSVTAYGMAHPLEAPLHYLVIPLIPLAVFILAFKFPVAGGSPALIIGLAGLVFCVSVGQGYEPVFRYLFTGSSALMFIGGLLTLFYAVRSGG